MMLWPGHGWEVRAHLSRSIIGRAGGAVWIRSAPRGDTYQVPCMRRDRGIARVCQGGLLASCARIAVCSLPGRSRGP